MDPIVSIVIPLFNKETTILRAINSVFYQTNKNFELIIVNDGSTDNSAKLVESLSEDKRIRLINQNNAGEGAARNRGIREAKTDLIAFLDADDEWLPGFLDAILMLREKYPDCEVFGTSFYISEDSKQLYHPLAFTLYKEDWEGIIPNYLDVILKGKFYPFNASSVAISKSALERVGGFHEGIRYGCDVDTWIRLSFHSKIAFINKPYSIYHYEAENRSSMLYETIPEEYYPFIQLKKYIQEGEVPPKLIPYAKTLFSKPKINSAKKYLKKSKKKQARKLIQSCFITRQNFPIYVLIYLCTYIPSNVYRLLLRIKDSFIQIVK